MDIDRQLIIERLVSFNNFYYCRFPMSDVFRGFGLVSFNNFYYCRYESETQVTESEASKLQ